LVVLLLTSVSAVSQEVEDTIRIKTRVVFLDALVKDKRTSLPITNLSAENFEVYDNGKPRSLSYFTREGQARKPLALVLMFDSRADGAGRFLKRPEILKAMEAELAKLPPGDEVAIMAMNIGEDMKRLWLSEFTNDRGKLAEVLAQVARFSEENADVTDSAKQQTAAQSQPTADAIKDGVNDASKDTTKKNEVVETETIKTKEGVVVTRTVMSEGSVNAKRVSKNGKMTVEFSGVYDIAAAVKDTIQRWELTRPNSQLSIVWVSDGIAPIFFEDRAATDELITRNNAIFNSLTVELRTLFKFLV